MRALIPVAGQRTHPTTFRALEVISQVATPDVESAVYDCLVVTDTGPSLCQQEAQLSPRDRAMRRVN